MARGTAGNGGGRLWALWAVTSLGLGAWLALGLGEGGDAAMLMPGPLSDGHHQLGDACEVCHARPFGGAEALQQACVDCHGEQRKKPLDSHPPAKFTDPRNAELLQKIDALRCASCHTEHRPEITAKDGLTQPRDLCFHCHSGIGQERPSHAGMDFMTCKDAGCHNYHDNRAIYTDFLVKHLDDADSRAPARVPAREFGAVLEELTDYPHDRYPVAPLDPAQADGPRQALTPALVAEWVSTAHARSGVNCTACHQPADDAGKPGAWSDRPGPDACRICHGVEQAGFEAGRHGMRLAAGLSAMRVGDARLPMHDDAGHRRLDCTSCHGAHRFDTREAALEACLACHADQHSLAYDGSPHQRLWAGELAGEGDPGSGVSCATCHMPRIDKDVSDWLSRVAVEHNQSAALSPATKMVRPVCLHCHGLGFSVAALADPALVGSNFRGPSAARARSMELARADHQRHLREIGAQDRQHEQSSAGTSGSVEQLSN